MDAAATRVATAATPSATSAETSRAQAPASGRGDQFVVDSRKGAKTALFSVGGLLGAGGVAGVAYGMTRGIRTAGTAANTGTIAGGIAVAAGIGLGIAGAMLQPKTASVLEGNLPSLDAAAGAAHALNRDTGIIRTGDSFGVVGFDQEHSLDRANVSSLELGDGSVDFEALVTQDGDLLRPAGGGYRNEGVAIGATDLEGVEDTGELAGSQLGTDGDHRRLVLGDRVGKADGYRTREDAATTGFERGGGEHAVVEAGGRFYLHELSGPSATRTSARGAELGPIPQVQAQVGKALYTADGPGDDYDWSQRAVPFTTDEPLGHRVRVPDLYDYSTAVVRDHKSSHASRGAAIQQAVGSTFMDDLLYGNYAWGAYDGYAVLKGETAQGDYHVYGIWDDDSWSRAPRWNENMGDVEAVVYKDHDHQDRFTGSYRSGDYLYRQYDRYGKDDIVLADADLGISRDVSSTGWRFERSWTDRTYDPVSSGGSGSGGPTGPGDEVGSGGSGGSTAPGDEPAGGATVPEGTPPAGGEYGPPPSDDDSIFSPVDDDASGGDVPADDGYPAGSAGDGGYGSGTASGDE